MFLQDLAIHGGLGLTHKARYEGMSESANTKIVPGPYDLETQCHFSHTGSRQHQIIDRTDFAMLLADACVREMSGWR